MNSQPPAGWYEDTDHPRRYRYWDGTQWDTSRSTGSTWSSYAAALVSGIVIGIFFLVVSLFALPTLCSTPLAEIQAAQTRGVTIYLIVGLAYITLYTLIGLRARRTDPHLLYRWLIAAAVTGVPFLLLALYGATNLSMWNTNAFCM